MNPATETAFAETQSKDVPMLATELGAYAGDHGDVFFEGDLPADERAKADDGENSLMDIDDAVNVDVLPAARKDIFSFFGKGTPKTKPHSRRSQGSGRAIQTPISTSQWTQKSLERQMGRGQVNPPSQLRKIEML